MVCAQPAKQKRARHPEVKQRVRWLQNSSSDATVGNGVANDAGPSAPPVEEPDASQQLSLAGKEVQKNAAVPSSLRFDIDAKELEDAMTACLVALHGGMGDAGLALREEVNSNTDHAAALSVKSAPPCANRSISSS